MSQIALQFLESISAPMNNTFVRNPIFVSCRRLSLGSLSEGNHGQLRAFYCLYRTHLHYSKCTFHPSFPSPTQRTLSFPLTSSSLTVSEQHRASTNGCHHPLLICHPIECAPHLRINTETQSLSPITCNTLSQHCRYFHLTLSQTTHFFICYGYAPSNFGLSIAISSQDHRS
jgi:hypothetical protein